MSEYRLVAVPKVESPDFDVPVGGSGDDERAVGGDVQTQNGKLVAVQRQEKLAQNTGKCT